MKPEDLTNGKIELTSIGTLDTQDRDEVSVIVKVRAPDYVPAGFRVRSKIDDIMFTADCSVADMHAAEDDPLVESMALSRRLTKTK